VRRSSASKQVFNSCENPGLRPTVQVMLWLVLILACAVAIATVPSTAKLFRAGRRSVERGSVVDRRIPGPARRDSMFMARALMTPAELRFFDVLSTLVPAGAQLCPKVRIGDLLDFSPIVPECKRRDMFPLIACKHVDFAVISRADGLPICAIELDDRSHSEIDRRERDRFVDALFHDASVPLLHVAVQSSYDRDRLSELLRPMLVGSRQDSEVYG